MIDLFKLGMKLTIVFLKLIKTSNLLKKNLVIKILDDFVQNTPLWKFVYVTDHIIHRLVTGFDELNSPFTDCLINILAKTMCEYPKEVIISKRFFINFIFSLFGGFSH